MFSLARRQLAAAKTIPAVLAVVIAVLALLGTAAPRLLRAAELDQVAHDLTDPLPNADVLGVVTTGDLAFWISPGPEVSESRFFGSGSAPWAPLDSSLRALRESLGPELRQLLGEPVMVASGAAQEVPTTPGSDLGKVFLGFLTDPALEDQVTLVEGSWPATPDLGNYLGDGVWAGGLPDPEDMEVPEFTMSAASAERVGWEVGETREAGDFGPVRLSGTFEPTDPDSAYWLRAPNGAEPYYELSDLFGLMATVGGYLHPMWAASSPHPMMGVNAGYAQVRAWYPLAGTVENISELEDARAQLAGLLAGPQPLGELDGQGSGTSLNLAFASPGLDLLDQISAKVAAVRDLVLLYAVGPLAAGIGVLVLGVRLVVDRRRLALTQLAGRGGSPRQIVGTAAIEALLLSVPAAALGSAAGFALAPASFRPVDGAVPLLLVLTTVGLLSVGVWNVMGALGRTERQDLGTSSRRRRVVETVVAVLSLVLLAATVQRAMAGEPVGMLAVLAPLAAIALAVLVVLHLYAFLVRAAERRAAAGRGALPFVGLARATRAPSGGLVPVVALVAGVAVTLTSVVMLSSVRHGSEVARWDAVGGDFRITGPIISEEDLAAIRAVEGVAGAARVGSLGPQDVHVDGERERWPVWAVDAEALRALHSGVPGITALAAELGEGGAGGESAPGDAGGEAAEGGADGEPPEGGAGGEAIRAVVTHAAGEVRIGERAVDVVGEQERVAGLELPASAVVVDGASAEALGQSWHPRTVIVRVEPGAEVTAVAEAARGELRSGAVVARDELRLGLAGSPLGATLAGAAVAASVVSALLVALVLVLTQMLGAAQRTRVVAVLRTLGMRRLQARDLAAWEMSPTVVIAVLAGIVVGIGTPWLITWVQDLRALTGGSAPMPVAVDPLLLGLAVGGILLVAAVAVFVSAWVAARAAMTEQLRKVEE